MDNKKLILGTTMVVFVVSMLIFGRMGGEFIPTLDEGDFVIQPVLPTGTSLSTTIEITTKIEKILKQFPEVEQVVSRIGAAEVPTDPMSMEESDIIVTLKPIRKWTSAETKDELAEKFKEALAVLPGFEMEFTQPIEMRFNELITGVRADVAIKIYGEDLAFLAEKADELKGLISVVDGASDISVEKVEGLPQMTVTYNRAKLSRYGLSVVDANRVISMGFAGLTAGTVFEGQKRFDLVIRLDKEFRRELENLRELMVPLAGGQQIPLNELAEIKYSAGPAKISRDMTRRHIVVGINVRNRDMESVVKEIQAIEKEKFDLPTGYSISYGGQYQNLRSARQRLMFAVPVALLLIFILLHFAFKSFRDALMIFSAIPLSAVGGILLLWIRGMPFSISAGVGFIALFGIAVLNGIVLIEHLKELKSHGVTNIRERIFTGTRQRLRPVVMTAAAAAMGFLPMAVSSSAGAEVQRPLATVVIGGLITSTLLTMIILPLFYSIFDRPERIIKTRRMKRPPFTQLSVLLLFLIPLTSPAREKLLTREEAVKTALENNPDIRAAILRAQQAAIMVPSGFNPDMPEIFYNYDQNNIAKNGLPIKVWGISQNFRFPTVYTSQIKLNRNLAEAEEALLELAQKELQKNVLQKYDELIIFNQKIEKLNEIDSMYAVYARNAEISFSVGETGYLEKLLAESKQQHITIRLKEIRNSFKAVYNELQVLMQFKEDFFLPANELTQAVVNSSSGGDPAGTVLYDLAGEGAQVKLQMERNNLFPGIGLEYFQGTNNAPGSEIYRGFRAGITLPLWFGEQNSKIKAARLASEVNSLEKAGFMSRTESRIIQLQLELSAIQTSLEQFEKGGRQLADELKKASSLSLQKGEIDFYRYLLSIENAFELENNYLDNLLKYNHIVYELNYLKP